MPSCAEPKSWKPKDDQRYGKRKLGSELHDELRYKQSCLEKILKDRKVMEADPDLGLLATNVMPLVVWPAKPKAHPQRRRSGITASRKPAATKIPKAISCGQVARSCRGTTASSLSTATTRRSWRSG